MKNKLIGFLFILLILACVPLINAKNLHFEAPVAAISAQKADKTELIAAKASKLIKKNYCEEAVKAIIIILNTNYKADKTEFADLKPSKNNSKLENKVKKLENIYLTYKGKPALIPCFEFSKGFTQPSKKFPYIKSAASPWDSLENSGKTHGVSLNGINELCKTGLDYRKALSWYLEKTEINVNR